LQKAKTGADFQAAWVVLVKLGPEQWQRYGLKSWIEAAKKRLHHNVLAIALANKLARIAWAVLNKGRASGATRPMRWRPIQPTSKARGPMARAAKNDAGAIVQNQNVGRSLPSPKSQRSILLGAHN
jgi:hypothetical protein